MKYFVQGQSVHFPAIGHIKHRSFSQRFKGMSYSQARRALRQTFHSKGEQNAVISFLREQGVLREG